MIRLQNTSASILSNNVVLVEWEISPTTENKDNFSITVLRSNSPEDEFESVSEPLINEINFRDECINLLSTWRKFYYKLLITDLRDDSTSISDPFTIEHPPDKIALEIVRRNNLLLREFISDSIDTKVYIAKSLGERCPDCWDPIKKRVSRSNCKTCLNTGFVGGFYNPINAKISFKPSTEMVRLLDIGELQPSEIAAWMSNYPLLSPRDMIVEPRTNRRWRVVTINKTERRRFPVHQTMVLREINENDIEYKIDADEADCVTKQNPFDKCQ